MQTRIMVNGEYGDVIASDDRGLQYGDGVFETIAVLDGTPLLWDAHIQRLQQGCMRLGIACPDPSLLHKETLQLTSAARLAVIKLIITRGSGGRGYAPPAIATPRRIISCHPWPAYPGESYSTGIRLHLCETRLSSNPALAGLKHLNRLDQVMARAELATTEGLVEGLMRAQDGRIVEGTMSNLFVIHQGKAYTPTISDCGIAGIMRAELMRAFEAMQIKCEQCDMDLQKLLDADEIILSNSIAGIWPVSKLQAEPAREYQPGPVYQALRVKLLAESRAWMP